MFDYLIRNGRLVDGTGNPWRIGDVAVKDGRIVAVGSIGDVETKRVINANGRIVSPGFIDAHSHTDATVEDNPYFDSTIRQGVTTEVVGNCGNLVGLNAKKSLGQHFRVLEEKGMSANLAYLAGHNAIRRACNVLGSDYTEEQFRAMENCLRLSLEDGAFGMSSGLEFDPGRMSRPQEILRLAKVLQEYDAIYTSHIRNRDANVWAAVDEFIAVVRAYGIRGEISHMNIRYNTHAPENAIGGCIERIKAARDEGLDILTDMTPLVYGTGSPAGILPSWLTSEKPKMQREMLLDPGSREKLRHDCDRYWRFIAGGEWDRVRVQGNLFFPAINGLTFPEIAKLWNKDPWDCYFDIMAAHTDDFTKVKFVAKLFTDEHLVETVSNPLYMLVVDGNSSSTEGAVSQRTHFPLHYVGMAWFLTKHVRELHTLSLEEAIRKMTSMPAQHFRIRNRGLLTEGYHADIVVFDLDKLNTPFDLKNPKQYTTGMDYVMIAGTLVLDEGKHLHTTPGKCLRRWDD